MTTGLKCNNGHLWADNSYRENATGQIRCRTCVRDRDRARRAAKKAAAQ